MNDQAIKIWSDPLILALQAMEETVSNAALSPADLAARLEAAAGKLLDLAPEMYVQVLADDMTYDMAIHALETMEQRRLILAAARRDPRRGRAMLAAGDAGFDPIKAAIDHVGAKTPVASALRSKDWASVPVALRQRGQFSAGVENVRVLDTIQEKILNRVSHERELLANGKQAFVDRDSFIRDLRGIARSEGLDTGTESLVNIASQARLGLIYDMQNQLAAGHARWKMDNDPDALDVLPAWRLSRSTASHPRSDGFWQAKWSEAFAQVNGRGALSSDLVALKTSPIWTALSIFGTPWPPFDWGSQREIDDVDRLEAEDLGLLTPADTVEPTAERDFNAHLQASVTNLSPGAIAQLRAQFGSQVEIRDGVASWLGERGQA